MISAMKFLLIALTITFISCAQTTSTKQAATLTKAKPIQTIRKDGLKNAYFASGCFWCVEAIYESVKGVKEVVSGYSGGATKNPTYRQVGQGNTGHSETVEVQYDPSVVSFEELLTVYYASQNPTSYGQSPDFGAAYRSIIFYQNELEKKAAEFAKQQIAKTNNYKKIVTEIKAFQKFWPAEDYHQDYEKRNPNYPYIVRVSIPRLNKFKVKHPELLKP